MAAVMVDSELEQPAVQPTWASSLLTTLGLVEGEILSYLDTHGSTALRQLIRQLEWPSNLVTMGAGALIRKGLIRGTQHDLQVVIEPIEPVS